MVASFSQRIFDIVNGSLRWMVGWFWYRQSMQPLKTFAHTHARIHARTHKCASGWAQSVGQTEIMCKRCAWNEENWIELNVVFSAQFCILLRELYYVHVEYEMLFETCTHRERLGVTEESFALLLLLLYYIILCVGRAGAVAAVAVVIVTIHVLCTQCVCVCVSFTSFSFSRSDDSSYVTYVSPKRRFNSINTYNRLHNLQPDSDLKI